MTRAGRSGPPTLSICMPTRNRREWLGVAVKSFLPAIAGGDVELVLSDNASTDATAGFLESLRGNRGVTIVQQVTNVGLDLNMRAVVEAASGEWAWLVGDDDCAMPNGVETVLRELGPEVGVLVVDGWHTDGQLRKLWRHLPPGLRSQRFHSPERAFEALWDRMPFGAFVVRRSLLAPENWQPYMGTSHAYSGAVWSGIAKPQHGFEVGTLGAPVVLLRGGKKSWAGASADILLRQIPEWFGLLPPAYDAARSVALREHLERQTSWLSLLRLRGTGQLAGARLGALSAYMTAAQQIRLRRACWVPRWCASLLASSLVWRARTGALLRRAVGRLRSSDG